MAAISLKRPVNYQLVRPDFQLPNSSWRLKLCILGANGHLVPSIESSACIPARSVGCRHRRLDAVQPMQFTRQRRDDGPALQMQR